MNAEALAISEGMVLANETEVLQEDQNLPANLGAAIQTEKEIGVENDDTRIKE